jgi:hypothetical protein
MTFEFDDVINTAKVIVNPEQSAAELKRLGIENAQLRTELDEAIDIIETINNLHPDFSLITNFLSSHPRNKK